MAVATRWVVIAISYEAAPAFDPSFRVRNGNGVPLVWVALFDSPSGEPDVSSGGFELNGWSAGISRDEYESGFAHIRAGIEAGNSYQVNYTFPLESAFSGNAWSCYRQLARAQGAAYSAWLDLGSHRILSFSPELFLRRNGSSLVAQPMKGTARRGRWLEEDQQAAAQLAASEKDRAENIMIVDLLRNDMGRVAETGSVEVSDVFAVEPCGELLQMTSKISASLRSETDFVDVMTALFPCGSVTGAPKVSSMGIIADVEGWPRGIYTGAIGFIRPGGDFVLNVAIRTLVIEAKTGSAKFGVGGGVTWDSNADGEYDEAGMKADFLTRADEEPFSLLETFALSDGDLVLRERHLQRARDSAAYFGFAWDELNVREALDAAIAAANQGQWRVRLVMAPDGTPQTSTEILAPLVGARRVVFASEPVYSGNRLLFHKTTSRRLYEREMERCTNCDDVIFWNERGEVTESSVANIAVEINGAWFTPERGCGLLGGTLRAELLAAGSIRERVISQEELRAAGRIMLISSVRGWLPAVLVEPG